MTQPLFPSTIGTQSRSAKFLTMETLVRKNQENNGQTMSRYLDKAVHAQGGRGGGGGDPPTHKTQKTLQDKNKYTLFQKC